MGDDEPNDYKNEYVVAMWFHIKRKNVITSIIFNFVLFLPRSNYPTHDFQFQYNFFFDKIYRISRESLPDRPIFAQKFCFHISIVTRKSIQTKL